MIVIKICNLLVISGTFPAVGTVVERTVQLCSAAGAEAPCGLAAVQMLSTDGHRLPLFDPLAQLFIQPTHPLAAAGADEVAPVPFPDRNEKDVEVGVGPDHLITIIGIAHGTGHALFCFDDFLFILDSKNAYEKHGSSPLKILYQRSPLLNSFYHKKRALRRILRRSH